MPNRKATSTTTESRRDIVLNIDPRGFKLGTFIQLEFKPTTSRTMQVADDQHRKLVESATIALHEIETLYHRDHHQEPTDCDAIVRWIARRLVIDPIQAMELPVSHIISEIAQLENDKPVAGASTPQSRTELKRRAEKLAAMCPPIDFDPKAVEAIIDLLRARKAELKALDLPSDDPAKLFDLASEAGLNIDDMNYGDVHELYVSARAEVIAENVLEQMRAIPSRTIRTSREARKRRGRPTTYEIRLSQFNEFTEGENQTPPLWTSLRVYVASKPGLTYEATKQAFRKIRNGLREKNSSKRS